jgi:hypothetical protein
MQIQLKRIKIQLRAKGIKNLLIIHDYDIEKKNLKRQIRETLFHSISIVIYELKPC